MRARFFKVGNITRKIAMTLVRPITKEMAEKLGHKTGYVYIASNFKTNEYTLLDGHDIPDCLKYHSNYNDWSICSVGFPLTIEPRKGLEDGIVDTIDKYLFIFHRDETQVELDIEFYHKSISSKEFLEWYAEYMFTEYLNPDVTLGFKFSQDFIIPVNNELEDEKDEQKAFMYILGNYINDVGVE